VTNLAIKTEIKFCNPISESVVPYSDVSVENDSELPEHADPAWA